ITLFSDIGSYNISSYYLGNNNYTEDSETLWIYVNDTIYPVVNITYPTNNTNSSDNNLDVNYTVSDTNLQACWYSNDTMTSNTTLTCGTNITAVTWSEGQHNVTIWANDSAGNENSSAVRFTIDTIIPLISYGNGTAVDYANLSQNNVYVNVSFTETNFANITFSLYNDTDDINSTTFTTVTYTINWTSLADNNYTYEVNITDIANNKNSTSIRTITLDTTAPNITLILPIDATSSTTTAYNFTFNVSDVNDILSCDLIFDSSAINSLSSVSKDITLGMYNSSLSVAAHTWSVNCTDIAGNIGNSSSRTLTVTAVPAAAVTPAGGGGGGGAVIAKRSIEEIVIDVKEISLDMVVETSKERLIKITNIGKTEQKIYVVQEGLKEMVSLSETFFSLAPGESKEITAEFIAHEESGIYTGRIFMGGKEILVSMNIRSGALLFDVGIVVPDKSKEIKIGDNLESQITLIPMGEKPRLDVTLNYLIKDFDGNILMTESETMLIDSQKSFKKVFYTGNLLAGDYVIGLELIYPNGVATSSAHFRVVEKIPFNLKTMTYVLLIGVVILIIAVIIMTAKYKKHKKHILLSTQKKRK
ncbi:MAG TPA: hypothetical protein VMZ91_04105, partial [Candidatus Paceibacterota bacterium]|nr:hypothetical protein [Candidatus Paceibacterota bacterium]